VIVVRHSVTIDEPVPQAGSLWGEFVAQRISDRGFVPDEWIQVDNACGVMGSGDVTFEPVSVARTKVTLSLELDLQPSDPETGPEVETAYHRAVAHLDRFHDFAVARAS
jgi:uncharacterized membrane protein